MPGAADRCHVKMGTPQIGDPGVTGPELPPGIFSVGGYVLERELPPELTF